MNKSILRLSKVTLVIAAAMTTSSAQAIYVCDACVVAAVNGMSGRMSIGFAALNTTVVSGFVALATTVKGVGTEVSQASTEGSKLVANANTRVTYDVARNEVASRYAVTNPCSVLVSSAGMAETARGAYGAGASFGRGGMGYGAGAGQSGVRAGSGGASADLARSIGISKGAEAAPAPEVTAKLAASGACSAFASGTRAAACRAAALPTGNSNTFANADVNADTLFDGPQKAGARTKKYTIDDADGSMERTAIEAFVRNMGTPLEMRMPGAGELKSDAGRRFLAIKDNFEARMSFAERPIRRQIGMLAPNAESLKVIATLLESDDAAWVTDYLNKAYPNWRAKGISSDEMMNLEVERRYMNKAWAIRVAAKMTPEQVAKEQVLMTAFQNVLLWKGIQESRENGLMLGGLNAATVRAESMPELRAAHAAATR